MLKLDQTVDKSENNTRIRWQWDRRSVDCERAEGFLDFLQLPEPCILGIDDLVSNGHEIGGEDTRIEVYECVIWHRLAIPQGLVQLGSSIHPFRSLNDSKRMRVDLRRVENGQDLLKIGL